MKLKTAAGATVAGLALATVAAVALPFDGGRVDAPSEHDGKREVELIVGSEYGKAIFTHTIAGGNGSVTLNTWSKKFWVRPGTTVTLTVSRMPQPGSPSAYRITCTIRAGDGQPVHLVSEREGEQVVCTKVIK